MTLVLLERTALTWRGVNYAISLITPATFPHLHTLRVTCPHLSAICDLQALDTLIIEPLFEDRPVLQDTNANVKGRRGAWCVPSNGTLKHLVIRSEDTKYTALDVYKTAQVCLPLAVDGVGTGPLRNLQSFKIEYPMSRFDDLDFASICPNLEEFEVIATENWYQSNLETIPASVKKMTYVYKHGKSSHSGPLPAFDLVPLTQLVDLTIQHTCDSNLRPLSLDGLLKAPPSLQRLRILGHEYSRRWTTDYTSFFERLARQSPHLKVLDIKTLPLPSMTLHKLQQAMPNTEILARRESLWMPEEGGQPRAMNYQIIEDRMPLIPKPPKDGVTYHSPVHIGEPTACDKCAAMVGSNVMEEHKSDVCPNRSILCPLRLLGCEFAGSASDFTKHITECPYYEWECLYCRTTMNVAEKSNHLDTHNTVLGMAHTSSISRLTWKKPEFAATKCMSCPVVLTSRKEAIEHSCAAGKVLMPGAAEIWDKWVSKGQTPVVEKLKSHTNYFEEYPEDNFDFDLTYPTHGGWAMPEPPLAPVGEDVYPDIW